MDNIGLPEINTKFTGYEIIWPDKIRIKAESCKLHTDGSFKAQLAIDACLNGSGWEKLMTPVIVNLTSGQARGKLVEQLSKRTDAFDWYAVVEHAAEGLLKSFKEGDPVEELWADTGDVKPPQYIIEPFLIKNYPNVIFGDPGSFKSAFAMALVMIGTLGIADSPLNLPLPLREEIRPLWLDWETDRETSLWTMTRLSRGNEYGAFPLQYLNMSLSMAQELDRIKYIMDATKANLLIIDSLGLAAGAGGGNLNDAEPAIKFYSALRQLQTTSLIIAHNAKSNEVKTKSILGSMFYTAQARNIWEVKKIAEPGDDTIDIALFHRKAPPFGKVRKAMGYRVDFEFDKIAISYQEATTVREFVAGMGTQARVTNVLLNGAMTEGEIADALEVTQNSVKVACSRLKNKGKIIKLPAGKWGLYAS